MFQLFRPKYFKNQILHFNTSVEEETRVSGWKKKKSTTLTKILNKAYLYSHKHQVLQVHSHKHKHIQSFVVFFFFFDFSLFCGTQSTHRAKHIVSKMWSLELLTCADRCVYFVSLRKRRVWPFESATSWFCIWGLKMRTDHRTKTQTRQPMTSRRARSVRRPSFKVLCLCQRHEDSSAWLWFPPPLWQDKAADSLVTLCKYIYTFFLNISIYSIYRISLYSIHIILVIFLLKHLGTFTWSCYFFFFIWSDNHRQMLADLLAML